MPAFQVAVLIVELHIPEAQSLKSKRQVLRSLKDRIMGRFNVSIAELDELDKWQRAVLGVAAIGNDKSYINGMMEKISALFNSTGDILIESSELHFL